MMLLRQTVEFELLRHCVETGNISKSYPSKQQENDIKAGLWVCLFVYVCLFVCSWNCYLCVPRSWNYMIFVKIVQYILEPFLYSSDIFSVCVCLCVKCVCVQSFLCYVYMYTWTWWDLSWGESVQDFYRNLISYHSQSHTYTQKYTHTHTHTHKHKQKQAHLSMYIEANFTTIVFAWKIGYF